MITNFHLSLPCKNVAETRQFYVQELGCMCGREAHNWIDIDLMGNQITFAHDPGSIITTRYYSLDDKRLPIFHVGIILEQTDWHAQWDRHKGKSYLVIEPTTFLSGKTGAHESFFIKDPNGYYLEFKKFGKSSDIFTP